jgi:hypothetical protein
MENKMENKIKGLDSDDGFVFIKHESDTKVWQLPNGSAEHSILLKESIIDNPNTESYGTSESNPMMIKNIKVETIPFIVAYMNFYNGKNEKDPPEQPIKNIHLSVIFGDEYHLFTDIYNETDSVKTKILKLNDHIESTLYFSIKHLHKKLCAIAASILKDLNIAEIKKLVDS